MSARDFYPPGTDLNDPHLTGEWPCGFCGGEGCWACKGSGIHPEESPACAECDSTETVFFSDLTPEALRMARACEERKYASQVPVCDLGSIVFCYSCGEPSK